MPKQLIMMKVDSSSAIAGLDKYSKDVIKKINDNTHNAGLRINAEVKESIAGRRGELRSVDTGHFMGNIYVDNTQDFVSYIFTPIDYAVYLEFGTSRMQPRLHFSNTLKRERSGVLDAIKQAVKK